MSQGRNEVVEYLRSHLVGPRAGEVERITDSPSGYYTVGVLYPASANKGDLSPESDEIVDEDASEDIVPRSPLAKPVSIGITFVTSAETLSCDVTFGTYKKAGKTWERTENHASLLLSPEHPVANHNSARFSLISKWRPIDQLGRRTVTVALVNDFKLDKQNASVDESCLFQVRLDCRMPSGCLHAQPSRARVLTTDEESELEFQFRNHRTYAIGHGCAASWITGPKDRQDVVSAECLPIHEVPSSSPTTSSDQILDIRWLSELATGDVNQLLALVDQYELAISQMRDDNPPETASELLASERLLSRMMESASRMRTGVHLLSSSDELMSAFRFANEAMLLQMWRTRNNSALSGTSRAASSVVPETPALSDIPNGEFFWRPFQLAFLLMNIEPLAEPKSPFRNIVDLIWFPTGGGKTEAYLLVSAFEIVRRRLSRRDKGAGTTVISRYTMRVLTAQQFERTSTLVCALELLRGRAESILGQAKISIGLWIGEKNTPNTFGLAKELLEDLVPSSTPDNPFAVQRCPWCHTRLIPHEDEPTANLGFRADNSSFTIFCPNSTCDFHRRLPLQVVDEALYQDPPTILLAVVDKFAALPREPRMRSFFGSTQNDAPSLVIQDELHLLGSSLGTVFGVYEAAVDTIFLNLGERTLPHVIASTATIRDSTRQIRQLFGRDARVFPSPGLSADYNFFSRIDLTTPGRLFVGVSSPSHTPATSIIRTVALLAQAVEEVGLSTSELDAYFTQVVYHNSLRELGKLSTFALDDIPDWIGAVTSQDKRRRTLGNDNIAELTGNIQDWALPKLLERLQLPASDTSCLTVLTCTNMLSVGVDIPRLGLMTVHGQPKSTSEFIQATSRVGRKPATHPGLIVVHYASMRPRDISHFETFYSYHQSLYRYVEPTSVTPWALPARERCLPAAVVGVVRHVKNLRNDNDPDEFDIDDPATVAAIEALANRILATEDVDAPDAVKHLQRIVQEWSSLIRNRRRELRFVEKGQGLLPICRDFGDSAAGVWRMPRSFRNVDRSCRVEVGGWY